ncbi:MAG: hypothetical protein QM817_34480 [Archangium sp.]
MWAELSAPKMEAHFLDLTRAPRDAVHAKTAVEFFTKFPIRFREQLGTAAAATGVAWLHGAKGTAFAKLKSPKAPNELVPVWHARVTRALQLALGPRAKWSSKKADATPLPTKKFHEAWLERAEHVHRDELDSLLETFANGPATQVAERAVMLAAFPVDARIADAAANFILRPSINASAEASVFTVCALLLCVHGNRSHRKTAEHLSSTVPSLIWLERALPDVEGVVAPAPTRPKTNAPSNETDFLKLIAQAPGDDARVATFMDWLLEKNDPRGTFLSLQRSGSTKGVATLLKKHEKTWLGSLAKGALKGRTVYRGGFAREVTLRCGRPADVPLADEPLLALLESLDVHGGTNLPIPEWLSAAKFPSLRRLISAPWIFARVPDSVLTPLDTLGVEGNFVKKPDELLAVLTRPLPNLRTLELVGDWREGAAEVARVKTLTRIVVETHQPELWSSLPKVELREAHFRDKSPAAGSSTAR